MRSFKAIDSARSTARKASGSLSDITARIASKDVWEEADGIDSSFAWFCSWSRYIRVDRTNARRSGSAAKELAPWNDRALSAPKSGSKNFGSRSGNLVCKLRAIANKRPGALGTGPPNSGVAGGGTSTPLPVGRALPPLDPQVLCRSSGSSRAPLECRDPDARTIRP